MKIIKEKFVDHIGFLSGIVTVLAFYVWYGTVTKYFRGDMGVLPCVLAAFVTVIGYTVCFYDAFANKKEDVIQRQLAKMNGFVSCFCALYFIAVLGKKEYRSHGIIVFSVLLFLIITVGNIVWYKRKKTETGFAKKIKVWIKERIGLCLLLLLCILLSVEESGLCYRWDSGLYYITVADTNLFSLSSMATYGHIAQTFGMLNSLVVAVFGSVDIGIFLMNVGVLLAGTAAFYGIMKACVPYKKQIVYTLATAVYALSPFTLGMVNYISLDFYMQCLFPIVIYYLVKKEWILHFIAAALFCFTKEPAIITYGCMCIGIVLLDIYKNRSLKRLFVQKKYYLMVLCAVLWVLTYLMLGPWSAGNGGVGFDGDYIIRKLFVLYIMNFNWILTVLSVGFIIWILLKKEQADWIEQLQPIIFAQIGFTVFSCLFATVNHARYIDVSFVVISILGMMFILNVLTQKAQMVLTIFLSCIMLVSVYRIIDPVTKKIFVNVDVGTQNVISTAIRPALGDESICNRMMLYFEKPFAQAVADSIEVEAFIVLPTMQNNTWYFNGMDQFHTIDDYRMAEVIWDTKKQKRVFFEGEDTLKTTFCEMADSMEISEMMKRFSEEKIFSYIYMDSIGAERIEEIEQDFHVIEKKEYSYRGYIIKQILFKRT